MINFSEAQELVRKNAIQLQTEIVSLQNSLGRVLVEKVKADRDYPPFNRSAMDGYAIRTGDYQVDRAYLVVDTLFAGDFRDGKYGKDEVLKIMTGAPVPQDFDAVVKVEDAIREGDHVKFKLSSLQSFENIARQGEDLGEGEVALREGQRVTPAEIALLASLGKNSLMVYRSPAVTIISTGDEIKAVGEPVLRHQIRNSNGPVLSAFFKKFGVDRVKEVLVEDNPAKLRTTLEQSLESDIIVLSGGVSMGDADFVPDTLNALGVEKIFHKVSIKPGKPVWFGKKPGGPVVFGLPGNPFSSQVTFKLFIEPFLRESFGLKPLRPLYLPSADSREKKARLDEFLPAVVVEENRLGMVKIKSFNGSGDVTATALSEGLVLHPSDGSSMRKGEVVAFYVW